MLTLDAVRTAVLSDQPWNRLDELVRAEQAAGRKVKDIYAELMSMADEIDATPGITEDGFDAFGDTLDALTGFCHHDCQYKDPPNTTLPTEEEIAKLPRWARVAFAARCARRVLPLYAQMWKGVPAERLTKLQRACEAAETSPAKGGIDYLQHLTDAWDADSAAAHGTASYVAAAVSYAVSSALRALRGQPDETTLSAVEAALAAAAPIADIAAPIRRDFDQVANLAEWQQWSDDTPVPPEVFGPIWPEGTPKGWPVSLAPAEV